MTPAELAPALLSLGRTEGSAHGFREAAKSLRAMADQLEQAAKKADEQAAIQKTAADALVARAGGGYQRGATVARRLLGAIGAARAAWEDGINASR